MASTINKRHREYCAASVTDGWRGRRCSRYAKDGSEFCAQHNPEAVKAREEKSTADWNEKWRDSRRPARLAQILYITLGEMESYPEMGVEHYVKAIKRRIAEVS